MEVKDDVPACPISRSRRDTTDGMGDIEIARLEAHGDLKYYVRFGICASTGEFEKGGLVTTWERISGPSNRALRPVTSVANTQGQASCNFLML
jgi:hypothetical protein